MKTRAVRNLTSYVLLLMAAPVLMFSPNALAQSGRLAVSFVSVCSDGTVPATSGTCPAPTTDSRQIVVGPDGVTPINQFGDLAQLADEHSTVLPPKYLPNHPSEYMFFVAAGGGMSVLKSTGPNATGQWMLDFTGDYGRYPNYTGSYPVFSSAMQRTYCPTVAHPRLQDATYDLNYAQAGTVFKDPTNPDNTGPGSLIAIYEGTNRCVGLTGGNNTKPVKNSFYSTIAVATSNDFGHTWPSYRYLLSGTGDLQFPLPLRNPCTTITCPTNDPTLCTSVNPCVGPNAPAGGSFSDQICILNDCHTSAPNYYGRYPVFSPPVTLQDAIAQGKTLKGVIGYQAPSAFVDDVKGDAFPYVYAIAGPLMITRAQLNGGTATLRFNNWFQGAFSQPGVSGDAEAISFLGPQGMPENCEAQGQHRTMPQISYVEQSQEYLLTFVCMSSIGDPATQTGGNGAAWFYSTNSDLNHQDQWSAPQEIAGSWAAYTSTKNGCPDYDGWYPTLMSLNTAPGHLATSGYAFYMHGCTAGAVKGGRKYSTRAFNINLKSTRTFQGIDTAHVYVLGTDGNLWLEHAPFGSVPPARTQVDGGVATFQAIQDGTDHVTVLDLQGSLWMDTPGTVPAARQAVSANVRWFQALSSETMFVLTDDGNLWLETGSFGSASVAQTIVDASVRDFRALDASRALVLGRDGNLWLETGPFGGLPPARVQVDGNVLAFQKAPGSADIYVLGSDGNLWLEQPPFGQVPPARVQVDGNVRSFQAMNANVVFVLGTDGKLWLESGGFGVVPPARQPVDSNVRSFEAMSLLNVYVEDRNGNLWLESAPFVTTRVQVDGNVK